MDVNLDRIALDFLAPAVQPLLDLGSGLNGARTLQEQLKQCELLRRQVDLTALPRDCVSGRIEHHAQMLDPGLGTAGLAAQQGPDPSRQLVQVERLDQVVIGAGVEPLDAIGDGIASGDDQNRQSLASGAQCLQHLQAVFSRKPQVQQGEVERLGAQDTISGFAVVDPVDGKAVSLQARANGLADHRVVFDQEQSHFLTKSGFLASLSTAGGLPLSSAQSLRSAAARLGVTLSEPEASSLMKLLDELARWNRTYNLTAITKPEDMVTHHLLDSLAIHADLQGVTVADVGTGAGFPGLPLAVVNPQRRFTLIDSNGKKVRFVSHAARLLQLTNVEPLHARVESATGPFDTVIARAFAALPDLLRKVAGLCDRNTRVLAMKGKWPTEELELLPADWRVEFSRHLDVPGLREERCVIALRTGTASA
jgi:16S rRNA (guanine527-N7)-methyltransferase